MIIKPLLKRYIQFHKLQKAKDEIELKTLILEDNSIDKKMVFYDLAREDVTSLNGVFFSLAEAKAMQSYMTHKRYKGKWSNPKLEEQRVFTIVELSLDEILKDDEKLSSFLNRMKHINPYDEKQIEELSDDFEVKVLWDFEFHFEPRYIYHDGKNFLFYTHKDAKLPWGIENGYSTMIDEDGLYGVVYNTGGYSDIKLEIALEFEYFYIEDSSANNGLVGVQKEKIQTDNYKEYICEIIDLKTKETYSSRAICGSLDDDNFTIVDEDKNLQYIKIDTQKRAIEAISKKYKSILNPIHYAPKPVQDKDTNLWGYIDNKCHEIIAPRFKDFGSFNNGYAIIKEDDKEFVIDLKGDVLIEPKDEIIHYDDELFFVKETCRWAVFKRDRVYIDFEDLDTKIKNIKKEKNLDDEEVFDYLKEKYGRETGYFWLSSDNVEEVLLRFAIVDKKRELHSQIDKLPLKEYIKLYDCFKSDKDLREAGLWGRKVKRSDGKEGYIGWNYPASASLYDMSMELPVDGFGIEIEKLELVKDYYK